MWLCGDIQNPVWVGRPGAGAAVRLFPPQWITRRAVRIQPRQTGILWTPGERSLGAQGAADAVPPGPAPPNGLRRSPLAGGRPGEPEGRASSGPVGPAAGPLDGAGGER